MRMYDIIKTKREGGQLSDAEIRFFINGFTDGTIPDYQASALLMAICINGMTDRETSVLTKAMIASGDTVDLSRFGRLSADKHSTGGVGDKTSIIVAPTVAALGGKVAKMSGRGLGHTGGTVDKLESIPGYRVSLSDDEFLSQADKVGVAIIGQTADLTPADKKLYALRDVTATIDSIPLIASSIMSKKIAAGSENIVLDVKYGSGAFMKTPEDAVLLAEKMVDIGKRFNRHTAALISDMNTPLGTEIGNSLEVKEAVGVLKGEVRNDLRDVSISLAGKMVSLIFGTSEEEGSRRAAEAIDNGSAYEKMIEWVSAQGGDISYIKDTAKFPMAKIAHEIKATESGYISFTDAESIGTASTLLGAGRKNKGDPIDHSAGISMFKKRGDRVDIGDTVMLLHTNDESSLKSAEVLCSGAIKYSEEVPPFVPHIYKTVE